MSAQSEPGQHKSIPYQGLILGGFVLLAAATLMIGHIATGDAIELREREDLLESLQQVIPVEIHDGDLLAHTLDQRAADGSTRSVYRATRDGRVTAVAFQVSGAGYAGAIDLLLSVDAGGRILGVRVLRHAETPGLGDKIEAAKDDWILAFTGRSLGNPREEAWAVRKDGGDFDQFTGATITPRAVVAAVHDGLLLFHRQKPAWLAAPESLTAAAAAGE